MKEGMSETLRELEKAFPYILPTAPQEFVPSIEPLPPDWKHHRCFNADGNLSWGGPYGPPPLVHPRKGKDTFKIYSNCSVSPNNTSGVVLFWKELKDSFNVEIFLPELPQM